MGVVKRHYLLYHAALYLLLRTLLLALVALFLAIGSREIGIGDANQGIRFPLAIGPFLQQRNDPKMIEQVSVRTRFIIATDEAAWRAMWADYCAFYEQSLPDAVTANLWARIQEDDSPINAMIAESGDGTPLGFANYVLHPHTWSDKTLCYLEDLFVRPEARGKGVGHALIESLIALGRERGWKRVYWHTNTENTTARRLYDRFAPADAYVRYTVSLPE